jgi:hypothetical protein
MSKYDALGTYLRNQRDDVIPMTFAEIEKVVGVKLPRSAFEYRPWWSNNQSNSVMTKIWLDAGFRSASVDMAKQKLVFERIRENQGVAEEIMPFKKGSAVEKNGPHPLIGALKGTFTIEPGYDLTLPAMPEWSELVDEKYGKEPGK